MTSKRTSEVLTEILAYSDERPITIAQFTAQLGDRVFAMAILLFAIPNSLPIPGIPGFSTVTGAIIALFAFQMVRGRSNIWLPYRIGKKQFSQGALKRLILKAMPAIEWLERFLCVRLEWMNGPTMVRLCGIMFIVLSCIISLPIPGGNFLPGLAMSLLALGMLEKDGLFVLCSLGFATMSILLMYKVIALFIHGLIAASAALF